MTLQQQVEDYCNKWLTGVFDDHDRAILLPYARGWMDRATTPEDKAKWQAVINWLEKGEGEKQ